MQEKKINNITKINNEELLKEYYECVDIYSKGLLLLEDITNKIKINRVRLSYIEEEIKKRNIEVKNEQP